MSDTPPVLTPSPPRKSRYLNNAPPPLQLKGSSHRPRSKRYSCRISREKLRASVQSFESGGPLTPLTARPKPLSKKEQHRRRLLKLKRTFGDEVPIEAINSSLLSRSTAEDMKELSVLGPQTPRLPQSTWLPSPRVPTAASGAGRNSPLPPHRSHKKGILTSLTTTRPTPSPLTSNKMGVKVSHEIPHPSPPVILISVHDGIPVTPSSDEEEPQSSSASARPILSGNITQGHTGQWPRTPFSHTFEPIDAHLSPARQTGKQTTAKRNERRQGWSGEWNQPDIQDVIERLRNMK